MTQRGKLLVPITTFKPDLDQLILDIFNSRYTGGLLVPAATIFSLCQQLRGLLLSEPCQLELAAPLFVVGDIHGQLNDLLRILLRQGLPPDARYLFLGDYVDRGACGVEVLVLLYALKLRHPASVFLLRGNHECARSGRRFGFQAECLAKYGDLLVWNAFVSTFNVLPFTAVVAGSILCVHGGLSPLLAQNAQLKRIARPTDVPDEGLLCDLLWADYEPALPGFAANDDRALSVYFGAAQLRAFLEHNGLRLLVRGHSLVNGVEYAPPCLTLFSAPCYRGERLNDAAVLHVAPDLALSLHVLAAA